jgi:hypothetical protein
VNALQQLAATPSCARVLSFDKLVKAVAKGAGSSSATVREVTKRYHRTGEITPEPKKPKIERDNPLHPLFGEVASGRRRRSKRRWR